jgi:hypothetical protein
LDWSRFSNTAAYYLAWISVAVFTSRHTPSTGEYLHWRGFLQLFSLPGIPLRLVNICKYSPVEGVCREVKTATEIIFAASDWRGFLLGYSWEY